jgi:acyl dehydratase
MLRRGKGGEKASREAFATLAADVPAGAEWRLGGDLGRRYASVSGDRNPIHMHSLTAKPLGFPGAIAHGMWTKARCLAALDSRLPDAFVADVRFRKPILLPARVEFACAEEGEEIAFAVRDAKRQTPHLDGRVTPLDPKPKAKTGRKAK